MALEFIEAQIDDDSLDGIVRPLENKLRSEFKTYQAQALHDYLSACRQVTAEQFYRDVFPEGALSDATLQEKGKYAGRIFRHGERSQYVNNDLTEITKCTSKQSATMNCIAYSGQGKSQKDARELYAMIFRVLLPEERSPFYVRMCLESMEFVPNEFGIMLPRTPRISPTYILTDDIFESVYFCYVLKDPIPMYHRIHKKLQRLYDATSRAIHKLWDISHWDDIQHSFVYDYECKKPLPDKIFQRYPVVGAKYGDSKLVAYKVGEKYDLDELNELVPKVSTVEVYDTKMTLEEAKRLYPDWYERRIVQHKKSTGFPGYYHNEGMYIWFLNKVKDNITTVELGSMEALASYAVKSNISRLTLMEDLEELHRLFIPRFSEQEITQHQSHAMEFFEDMPHLARVWKVKTIEKLSGLRIERSKRNGRTQAEHLALLHEAQSANSCQERVVEWFNNNAGKTQKQCSQELVISQKTVSKWWPTHKKRKKKKTAKNPCPICGTEMTRTKLKPHFWGQKSQYYTRIDKDCPKCGHHIKGKSYPCQRPD